MTSNALIQQIKDLASRSDYGFVRSEVTYLKDLASKLSEQYAQDIENEYRAGYNAALKVCLGNNYANPNNAPRD